jgi:hypothetical protein
MLLLDEDKAVHAIPHAFNGQGTCVRATGLASLDQAVGLKTDTGKARLAEMEAMLRRLARLARMWINGGSRLRRRTPPISRAKNSKKHRR